MVISKIIICPVCGKKTYVRIEDGGYLDEYPIRVNCINCRALLKGSYIMNSKNNGLRMVNAEIEECDVDSEKGLIRNADYIAEISGELPTKNVSVFDGKLPTETPYINAADYIDPLERIERLKHFKENMEEWKKAKSIAFQLLEEGSIEYIAKALQNKLGDYFYECDNYLKSLQCLQDVALDETKYFFVEKSQVEVVKNVISNLAIVDKEKLDRLIEVLGKTEGLIVAYRKIIEVVSDFMKIYPNVLPAETYIRYSEKIKNVGISTCSFNDVKTFYQDAYETLLSMMHIPVCLDNIVERNDYEAFSIEYDNVWCHKNQSRNFKWYMGIDKGTRINKLSRSERFQQLIDIPANRLLRNGIGHNNITYDGVTQTVLAYDLKKPEKINYEGSLMDVATDCIGLVRSAIIYSEIILYLLRYQFRKQGVRTVLHPRFYKHSQPNDKCPCGSGFKYKKCCMAEIKDLENKKRLSDMQGR